MIVSLNPMQNEGDVGMSVHHSHDPPLDYAMLSSYLINIPVDTSILSSQSFSQLLIPSVCHGSFPSYPFRACLILSISWPTLTPTSTINVLSSTFVLVLNNTIRYASNPTTSSTSVSIPSQTTNGAPLSLESSTSKKIKTQILASTSTSKMLPSLLLDNCTACISFFLRTIRIERRSLMATRLSPTGSLSLNTIREDSSLTIFLLNYPVISQSMSPPSIDDI